MVIVYTQSRNIQDYVRFFNVHNPSALPLVETTLGNLSNMSLQALKDEEATVYFPVGLQDIEGIPYEDITEVLLNTDDKIIMIEFGTLPTETLAKDDMNPGVTYTTEGIRMGHGFKNIKAFLISKEIVTDHPNLSSVVYNLNNINEIALTLAGVGEFQVSDNSKIYSGSATIDEDSEITSSKVFGPCLIVGSRIINSTIYPGTVIVNSLVQNSEVEDSYINVSRILESSVKESTVTNSNVNYLDIQKSELPNNTSIGANEKKRLR